MEKPKEVPEYTKPEVKDYGDLRELTLNTGTFGPKDLPQDTAIFHHSPPVP